MKLTFELSLRNTKKQYISQHFTHETLRHPKLFIPLHFKGEPNAKTNLFLFESIGIVD